MRVSDRSANCVHSTSAGTRSILARRSRVERTGPESTDCATISVPIGKMSLSIISASKLLAYALGRTLIPSDDEILSDMPRASCPRAAGSAAWSASIVASPQFRNRHITLEKQKDEGRS